MTATRTTSDLPNIEPTTSANRPLTLEDLFEEQQTLTAVETFSRAHDAGDLDDDTTEPDQARYYKSLIPATPPKPGQQYAFEVDLDSCSGCKACVVACHSLNGLAEDEAWRDVGLLHGAKTSGTSLELPVLQHVTTACHHCVKPGCLEGCPVNAYEKDPKTGIVRHLDDQCFGCQYCTLMCPYEVPKYHADHGIVRKCDMCSDRLGAGEAPACVQACPHEAIKIRTVSVDAVKVAAAKATVCDVKPRAEFAIPYSPEVNHTIPTTVYKTSKLQLQDMEPVDLRTPQPAHAHGPLSIMLALTQVGVGGFVAAAVLWLAGVSVTSTAMKALTFASLTTVQVGLMLATLHLGRPHLAFRAILGWRHSWLSREMLAFGAFMPLAILVTNLAWSETISGLADITLPSFVSSPWVVGPMLAMTALAGLAAVFTSVLIYVVTKKPLWSLRRTVTRFGLTTAVGGAAVCFATTGYGALFVLAFAVAKLAFDMAILSRRNGDKGEPLVRTAVLLAGPLSTLNRVRVGLGVSGLVIAAMAIAWWPLAIPAALLLVAGETVERWLFFTAATGPKMPGQVSAGATIAAEAHA